MKVYYFKLKKLEEKLPERINNHINSYHDLKRMEASLHTWQHLMLILRRDYQIDLTNDIIEFKSNGKPDLIQSPYHFSLSHSDEYGAILISRQACGIDLQKEFDNLKLATKILNDVEKEEFEETRFKIEYLNKKWAAKEAYGKALGTGLNHEVYQSLVSMTNTLKIDNYYLACYPNEEFVIEVL